MGGEFTGTITNTVGSKLPSTYEWILKAYPRRIISIGVSGGSAAGDTQIEVKAGGKTIAKIYNTHTTNSPDVNFMKPCSLYVPAGTPLGATVIVSPGSGSAYLHVVLSPTRLRLTENHYWGMVIEKQVTAVTAALNYDFADGENDWMSDHNARILSGMSLVGSAAAGDTILELSVGGLLFSELHLTTAGLTPDMTIDLQKINQFIGANRELEVLVTDAAATNPVCLTLIFDRVNISSRMGVRRR